MCRPGARSAFLGPSHTPGLAPGVDCLRGRPGLGIPTAMPQAPCPPGTASQPQPPPGGHRHASIRAGPDTSTPSAPGRPATRARAGWARPGAPGETGREGRRRGGGHSTCPRSRVTLTSLYSGPRDSGGLCHQRSVPSMALLAGCALLLLAAEQMSQYWPCGEGAVRGLGRAGPSSPTPHAPHPRSPDPRPAVTPSLSKPPTRPTRDSASVGGGRTHPGGSQHGEQGACSRCEFQGSPP